MSSQAYVSLLGYSRTENWNPIVSGSVHFLPSVGTAKSERQYAPPIKTKRFWWQVKQSLGGGQNLNPVRILYGILARCSRWRLGRHFISDRHGLMVLSVTVVVDGCDREHAEFNKDG